MLEMAQEEERVTALNRWRGGESQMKIGLAELAQ